ncbi:flagellar motor switch phosphatase FliY [Psychrobacillus psychrodurans]|uniref:Flagellar motor switch phosphatase FliY n=1 Tax=Psychrobacillus psychrodurans TaxID=126157 RepID=A0A9X3L7I7_9BACI|nr:flagellar motor switch phosphatase FliY [Psychrobacillus psychrodurans]MCZ8532774.1 flagellar motor switch phosphatase FliY [Psychrobacillus psychrodurans]
MSDDMLSQEEIEALLRGTNIDEEGTKEVDTNEINIEDYLDSFAQDTLGEIGNISFGSSATALSSLLGQKVDITTPNISMINRRKLKEEFPHPYVAVEVKYTTGLIGMNLLVIKQSDAAIIADLMLGGDGLNPKPELSEIQLSAVQEAMNQMMGSAATSMSTVFNKKVDISPPSIDLMNLLEDEGTEALPADELLIKISFRLKIGELIDSNIMQLLPLEFGLSLVKSLIGEEDTEVAATITEEKVHQAPAQQQSTMQTQQAPEMPTQQQYNQHQSRTQAPQVEVQQAQFASFEAPSLSQNESRNLNLLLDIPLQVTVELGRTKRTVKEILELTSGSIIELDKLAGEPVDILVNNRHVAKGEVVVIDENFGVRITDILSQAERINNLR